MRAWVVKGERKRRIAFAHFMSLTYWQEYLLILVGGYLGSIFILLFTMFISAKTKSSVVGVIVPFVLIFLPTFLSGIGGAVGILLVIYVVLSVLLCPAVYQIYRKAEVK